MAVESFDIKVAIVSQDQPLRQELAQLLPSLWPELSVCGVAETGQAGLELIEQCQPQIVLCDMPLPDLCGMELGLGLAGKCHPVFLLEREDLPVDDLKRVTVDFLLKPINRDQLRRKLDDLRFRFFEAVDGSHPKPASEVPPLRVMDGSRIRMLPVDEILAAQHIDEQGCVIYTAKGEMRTNHSLRELMAELPYDAFRLVHRHVLIQVAAMERLERGEGVDLFVKLKGLEQTFPVNAAFSGLFGHL